MADLRLNGDSDARVVYVYEVGLSGEDGLGNSGWTVKVVTDDPSGDALLRIARLTLDERTALAFPLLHSVQLLHMAHLDPKIAT